jgi:tRNA (mo5U34)-methyltransferase
VAALPKTQPGDARAAVASNPFWYHTLDLAPGVRTPGQFDLRPIVDRMPWPDVRGKRCLDVGTSDGYLAFELERRGAREVVAADLADHEQWDWPAHIRANGVDYLRAVAGPRKGLGLRVAKETLGSSVQPVEISAYDLSPERLGEFDVVLAGSLLLHLRDPLRALEAIRSVCTGQFLSANQVDPATSVLWRRRPLTRLDGVSPLCQWWLPNPAAHRQMLTSMGFEIERETGVYAIPFGSGHAASGPTARALLRRAFARGEGVPHHAVLARPRA